ncbi:MAG: hypothetical protein JWO61_334 [Candidatus Saccharibacteria bacterium]|nr:hypothetical protein [Candidatus Saccharibacteria bacterium]
MEIRISLSSIKNSLGSFFGRYHFIIFFVLIVTGLSTGILSLYSAIQLSDQANGYTSQENNTSFDQDTIKRLRNLKDSNQQTEKLPTTGRVSPF